MYQRPLIFTRSMSFWYPSGTLVIWPFATVGLVAVHRRPGHRSRLQLGDLGRVVELGEDLLKTLLALVEPGVGQGLTAGGHLRAGRVGVLVTEGVHERRDCVAGAGAAGGRPWRRAAPGQGHGEHRAEGQSW